MSGLLIYDTQPNQIPRCFDTDSVRIMVMGDNCSGKTSFILRCLNGTYRDIEAGMYMEDIYRRPLNLLSLLTDSKVSNDHDIHEFINSKTYNKKFLPKEVQFLDASPFEIADFSELRNQQIIQSDAFILCFDPTSMESLLNLRTYQRRIERVRGIDDTVPVMVVATKSDLMSERKVSSDDILEMMNRFELSYTSNFMEISSKHDINVKKLFVKTLIKAEQYKYQQRAVLIQKQNEVQMFPESISDVTELSSVSDMDLVGPTNHEHVSPNSNQTVTNAGSKDLIAPTSNTNNSEDIIGSVNSKVRLIEIKSQNGRNDSNNMQGMNGLNKSRTNSSRSIVIREKTADLSYNKSGTANTQSVKKRHNNESCCVLC
ncbi:similar to Saccharomyces cerevisiae YHR022C Putative protein of unknown function [Maudiozyma barnettii]|mgnify:CR=1 FL=1|nr:similar to Saccharomyces cerevisiae YHR022C Putative protein of unknown function [Kazachstania barnettii]